MDLFSAALSLVIYKQGSVAQSDVDDLLARYKTKQGMIVDKRIFMQELSKALNHYRERTRCVFVCTEISCRNKSYIDLDEASFNSLSVTMGCDVEGTGCHWVCEQAPVLTLKLGQTLRTYSHCSSSEALGDATAGIKKLLDAGEI